MTQIQVHFESGMLYIAINHIPFLNRQSFSVHQVSPLYLATTLLLKHLFPGQLLSELEGLHLEAAWPGWLCSKLSSGFVIGRVSSCAHSLAHILLASSLQSLIDFCQCCSIFSETRLQPAEANLLGLTCSFLPQISATQASNGCILGGWIGDALYSRVTGFQILEAQKSGVDRLERLWIATRFQQSRQSDHACTHSAARHRSCNCLCELLHLKHFKLSSTNPLKCPLLSEPHRSRGYSSQTVALLSLSTLKDMTLKCMHNILTLFNHYLQ